MSSKKPIPNIYFWSFCRPGEAQPINQQHSRVMVDIRSTIFDEFPEIEKSCSDSNVVLSLYDEESWKEFLKTLGRESVRRYDALIILASASNPETFQPIVEFFEQKSDVLNNNEGYEVILVCTQIDKLGTSTSVTSILPKFAREHSIQYFEVSSLTKAGINDLSTAVTEVIMRHEDPLPQKEISSSGTKKKSPSINSEACSTTSIKHSKVVFLGPDIESNAFLVKRLSQNPNVTSSLQKDFHLLLTKNGKTEAPIAFELYNQKFDVQRSAEFSRLLSEANIAVIVVAALDKTSFKRAKDIFDRNERLLIEGVKKFLVCIQTDQNRNLDEVLITSDECTF
jgi:GTPase SAR1 family protein